MSVFDGGTSGWTDSQVEELRQQYEAEIERLRAALRAMQEAATNSYDMPIGAWQHAINEALERKS